MFFILGGARPRRAAWLCFHLLLCTTLVTSEKELCRSWTSGVENPAGPFPCPGPMDEADARFCCGTCSAPYCCSSEAARLDQTRCPEGQLEKETTASPQPTTAPAPAPLLPGWAVITALTVGIILVAVIGYSLRYTILFAYRLFHHWCEARNPDRFNSPLLPIHFWARRLPFLFDYPPPHCENPPPYSAEDPHGPRVLSRTSNVPPVAQLDPANAGYPGNEARPSPSCTPEPALTMGGLSQACVLSSVLSSSDAEEACVARPRRSASLGCVPPRYNDAEEPCVARPRRSASVGCGSPICKDAEEPCVARPRRSASVGCGSPICKDASAVDCDDPPTHSDDSRAPATLGGNPQDQYAAQSSPQVQQMEVGDALPRCSNMASATTAPEDPPPKTVAFSHGLEVLPHALDSPPGVPFQHATPGAGEDEMIKVMPPAPPSASAAGSISEPAMEMDELNLHYSRL